MLEVEIRIRGQIDPQWSDWFGGLTISCEQGEKTTLSGQIADQAALYGLIARLRDLGLSLISVTNVESDAADTP